MAMNCSPESYFFTSWYSDNNKYITFCDYCVLKSQNVVYYNHNQKGSKHMNDFATRLKELRKNAHMNQAAVAREIGVAQTAIANYESGARFPSEDKLIKLAILFGISIDMLLGREAFLGINHLLDQYSCMEADAHFYIKLSDDVIERLLQGKKQEVINMILALPQQGVFIQDIYHKIFQYVLYKTGWLWETGVIDVAKEHYISQVIEQLMPLLMQQAHKKNLNGRKAICFTPVGEEHVIVNHMISDFLELEGFESHYLGRNIPLKDIEAYIQHLDPDVVILSITLERHRESLDKTLEVLERIQQQRQFKIIVGGNPLKDPTVPIKAQAIGTSLEDTVRKALQLCHS